MFDKVSAVILKDTFSNSLGDFIFYRLFFVSFPWINVQPDSLCRSILSDELRGESTLDITRYREEVMIGLMTD